MKNTMSSLVNVAGSRCISGMGALVRFMIISIFLCSPVFAAFSEDDAGTRGAQFLKLPVGARAIGMGEAYTAIGEDANALYYNVAGLAMLEKKSAEYMYSQYVENTNYHWVGYAMPISEKAGSVGIGLQYFNSGNIDKTDIRAVTSGNFNPRDLAVNLGYAHKVFGMHSVGLNVKIINSKIEDSATTVAVDLGAQCAAMMEGKLLLGLALQNLGGTLKYETANTKLPVMIKLGSGYKLMENWITTLDLVFPDDNSPTVGWGTDYKYEIQEGMSLSGRLGYNSRNRKVDGFNGVTVGFGFGYEMVMVDYAWMPMGDLGSTHRISAGVKF